MKIQLAKLLLSIAIFSCTHVNAQTVLPKNLEEAISYFQEHWTKKELDEFAAMPEKKAVVEWNMGTGTWIRNNWVRGRRDTALTNYFTALGINVPDDISSIILTSLHRELNHQDIDLAKQVQYYKDYWKPIEECDRKAIEIAVLNYNKFKAGDRINIYMPVSTKDGESNAVLYDCPNVAWTFHPEKDLLITGQVVKKYTIGSPENVFFTVRILSLSQKEVFVLMKKARVGGTLDFSLKLLRIE